MFRTSHGLLVLILCASHNWAKDLMELEAMGGQPAHCTYEYAYEMYGAHCANRRLAKLPNLRSGIEILDFSENKLKEIAADTFSSYTSLRYLYLADNQIYLIEEDGFSSLTNLESLDLSNNVIRDFPNSLFQLPSLRKLYLRGNPMIEKNFQDLALSRPIQAPLQLLDFSECKIRVLPEWGSMPQLTFYNISYNPLTELHVNHFAALCNLGRVDLSESLNGIKLCNLKPAMLWFQEKQVSLLLEDYSRLNTAEFKRCPTGNDTEVHNATYNSCKAGYSKVQNVRASRRTWLTIGGGLAGFLVGFILLLYIMHRHNVAQTKTAAEKLKQSKPKDGDKQANAVLLNDVA